MEVKGFNLLLHDFCDYCGCFEPDIEKYQCDTKWGETPRYINNIRCKNRIKCARIAENVENRMRQNYNAKR